MASAVFDPKTNPIEIPPVSNAVRIVRNFLISIFFPPAIYKVLSARFMIYQQ